jgi:hypothetical protein
MNDEYKERLLRQFQLVFGRIPAYVAGNPYGGGQSYYNKDGVLKDSGLFAFETKEELDAFIAANPDLEYVKVGDIIY